jgi:quercetin dioxygenase-like cupin family protein
MQFSRLRELPMPNLKEGKMIPQELETRIVRYGELKPCTTAFIDAHTPGSDRKENFTIIGAGVTESRDQHIHIRDTPGFNIGAAGQPPNCRNSLHSHTTAEVFFVLSGRWRFFWGRNGNAGEFIANEGDIFNIPTGIFRGFENVGTHYGVIMAILGGDDAGGGVIWAPQVIEDARDHGLVLGENGILYDSKQSESLPNGIKAMPLLSEEELKAFPEPPADAVIRDYVARYQDLLALAANSPAKVIGENALLKDRPGFEVELLTRGSISHDSYSTDRYEVLMVMRGHWRLSTQGASSVLAPGDTCLMPPGLSHALAPSMSGEASLFRITNTDDGAGPTWQGQL